MGFYFKMLLHITSVLDWVPERLQEGNLHLGILTGEDTQ